MRMPGSQTGFLHVAVSRAMRSENPIPTAMQHVIPAENSIWFQIKDKTTTRAQWIEFDISDNKDPYPEPQDQLQRKHLECSDIGEKNTLVRVRTKHRMWRFWILRW